MAVEVERKFLVANDAWRGESHRAVAMRQGYLTSGGPCSVRIRIAGDAAWLNVKGAVAGAARPEFEYQVPLADAEAMFASLELFGVVTKTRHYVEGGPHTWEIDVFEGDNAGLIVAEIELESADETFEKPAWLGAEVTDDIRYYNAALAQHPYSTWSAAGDDRPG